MRTTPEQEPPPNYPTTTTNGKIFVLSTHLTCPYTAVSNNEKEPLGGIFCKKRTPSAEHQPSGLQPSRHFVDHIPLTEKKSNSTSQCYLFLNERQ
ncbi:hypothetical protein TNCV_4830381 [Trichonephila clavipes]|nr:hypothetical protein TNCV_4830381 [Trichonephila clavipes]